MNSETVRCVEKIIVDLMHEYNVPGISVGVIDHGEIVYSKGFGARNLEKNLPMTADTMFGIGSITKSFTALAILQLQEEGKLSVHDPISQYVDVEIQNNHTPITIHHLLSHSSGIPELDGTVQPLVRKLGLAKKIYPMTSADDFLRHFNGASGEIHYPLGERFYYNNDAFTLLGMIIEKVSNQSIVEYFRIHVFEPLGMRRTALEETIIRNDPDNNVIVGYAANEGIPPVKPAPFPYDKFLYAAGGILSTAHEMLHYLETLMNRGEFNETHIISPNSADLLWKPVISTPYGKGRDPRYCYGWIREDDFLNFTLIHHGGNVGVSSARVGMIPDLKLGVVVGENDGKAIAGILMRAILAAYLGKDPYREVPELFAKDIFHKLVGKYRSYRGIYELEITQENYVLFAKMESDEGIVSMPLCPVDLPKLIFRVPSIIPTIYQDIRFEIDARCETVSISLDRYIYHKV